MDSELGKMKETKKTTEALLKNARRDRSALMTEREELKHKLKRVDYENELHSAQIQRLRDLVFK